jgi:hypothetical protein
MKRLIPADRLILRKWYMKINPVWTNRFTPPLTLAHFLVYTCEEYIGVKAGVRQDATSPFCAVHVVLPKYSRYAKN